MDKHTPGPWEVRTIDDSLGSIDTVGGKFCIAQAQEITVADRNAGSPERRANARLIAAAPELIALLQELVDIEGPQPGTAIWADKALAAIAKATGEQP